MALFYYESIDATGKKSHQVIDAPHENEAKERLRKQNIIVLNFSTERKKELFSTKKSDLKGQALVTFTTQLAELLKANLPLYESLISLEEEYAGEKFHHILATICEDVKGGKPLSKSMEAFPKSFNNQYIAMIEAAEATGSLDKALSALANSLQKAIKLKKTIFTASIYPLVLLSFALFVIVALLTFVVPSMEAMIEDRATSLITKLVMNLSHFFTRGWPFYIPGLLLLGLGSILAVQRPSVKLWIHCQSLKIPLIKALIIETVLSRFFRTLGTLLQGGVSIARALSIAKKVMNQPQMQEIIEEASKKIIEGSSLSKELKKSPLIPSLVPRLITVGEESGKMQEMTLKIAEIYEEEVEKKIARLLALMQPAILLILGAIVGMIMLGVLLPLTDIQSFIGGN